MKHAKYILTLCLLAMVTTASAQFANNAGSKRGTARTVDTAPYDRIYVGYNPLTIKVDEKGVDDASFSGLSFGYTHGFSLSKKVPLFLEAGLKLNYTFKKKDFGEKDENDDEVFPGNNLAYGAGNMKFSYLSLSVPVNLAYKISIPNSEVSITPFVGVTLKYNILAKTKYKFDKDEDADEDDYYYPYSGYAYPYDDEDGYNDGKDKDVDLFDKKDVSKNSQWNRFQVGWQIGAGLNYKALYVGFHYGSDFGEIYKKAKTANWGLSLGYNF